MTINASPTWKNLQTLKQQSEKISLKQLFNDDAERCDKYSLNAAGLTLDYSKNILTTEIFEQLLALTQDAKLQEKIQQFFQGEAFNQSENRPALHPRLREPHSQVSKEVLQERQKIKAFCEKVSSEKKYTDIVNLGIGGSDLGPKLICDALHSFKENNINFHFISNVDDFPLQKLLERLNPETTLFIVVSKSFGTVETLLNMQTAQNWLLAKQPQIDWRQNFVAITANPEKALAKEFDSIMIFRFWDWVGGRYSLWSAVGLSIALCIGYENFEKLLAGAHAMDKHFCQSDFNTNMPVVLALLEIWYSNFWHAQTQAIIPYTEKLNLLPSYLQQLVMESNGKSISHEGTNLNYNTAPIIWGEAGTNCQHSFMQLLHQGSHLIPVDFIFELTTQNDSEHHRHVLANGLGQARVLMLGKDFATAKRELLESGMSEENAEKLAAHKVMPGNRPSNIISFQELTPETLGALIALYEHKVFTAAAIWNINPFDQWGVEMGKVQAKELLSKLSNEASKEVFDSSTEKLIKAYWEYSSHY